MTVITAESVERAQGELIVAKGDVITPLARDRAAELGVTIRMGGAPALRRYSRSPPNPQALRSRRKSTRQH
jgi:hypothetical protein